MKKRFFILSVVLFSTINFLSAQITFQKTFNAPGFSWGYDVHQTTDGGYIIAGSYEILGVGFLPYLIKTDAYGDTLWTKIGIGAGAVQQTTDGGYICGGVLKTDANGNQLWAKSYHLPAYSSGPTCFQQTADGGYILAGYVQSTVASNTADVYLFKTDSNGNCLWSKTFGGPDEDKASYVQQTNDGGFIITGSTSSFGTNQNLYLIKTDTIGNLVWSKTYDVPSGGAHNNAVQQTNDGGYIIAGSSGPYICLIKTNANGDTLWTKAMGNPTFYEARYVQQTTDGGYIITGNGYLGIGPSGAAKPILIKTDVNGDLLWIKAFSASVLSGGSGYSVKQTTDGGYIITGSIDGFSPTFPQGVYLVKTDSMGNSGCYQVNDFIMVSNAATQVTIPATIVTSPTTSVTTPVVTTYGSGGVVNTICFSVGMNEITKNNNFSVSPNPSPGNFIITLERAIMKGYIEILNTLGEIIYAENIFNESEKEIKLKNFSRGIYFVKVFDGEKYYCKKIIIEP